MPQKVFNVSDHELADIKESSVWLKREILSLEMKQYTTSFKTKMFSLEKKCNVHIADKLPKQLIIWKLNAIVC